MRSDRVPRLRRAAGWLGRGLAVAVVVSGVRTAPVMVTLGPRQQVSTEHPLTCVHTRLMDEVEEWKIKHSLELVREMGAATIVEFFPWPYVESAPGQYNWAQTDLVIAHARAQGLRVIARLGMVPSWAQPDPDTLDFELTLNYLEEDSFPDFAAFVEAFTARYADDVAAVIIWNEPNLAFEWGYQPPDPARYARLVQLAGPAAKRGNPDVLVLAGALAPTLEPVGSPYGMNELDFLRGMYEAGAQGAFDALAVHTYGFRFPPAEPPDPDVLNFRRAELLRAIMVEYGDGDLPVFITESGWNDHPRWTKAVRPGQRITYTLDAYEWVEAEWPWAETLCVWVFRTPMLSYSYHDYFSLVTPGFTQRPLYDALKGWARGTEPAP